MTLSINTRFTDACKRGQFKDIVLFERAAALCERYNHSDVQLREYVESEAKSLEAKVRYLEMFIDTMTH